MQNFFGYLRVSTLEQNNERQRVELANKQRTAKEKIIGKAIKPANKAFKPSLQVLLCKLYSF